MTDFVIPPNQKTDVIQPNWCMAFYELAIEVVLANEENKANFDKHIGSKVLFDEAMRVIQHTAGAPRAEVHHGGEPMTDYRTMPAGRVMDALVAEKVMGWRLGEPEEVHSYMMHGTEMARLWKGSTDSGGNTHTDKWSPSTDIAAAWEVVEKLRAKYPVRIEYDSPPDDEWICVFGDSGGFIGIDKTAPLAICRAALIAVEGVKK